MKGLITAIVLVAGVVAVGVALAGGFVTTEETDGGAVAVTNSQANTVWAPAAVLLSFGEAATGTVTVSRVSLGRTYTLGTIGVTGALSTVWVPEAWIPFSSGDVLRVSFPAVTTAVQVVRSGG